MPAAPLRSVGSGTGGGARRGPESALPPACGSAERRSRCVVPKALGSRESARRLGFSWRYVCRRRARLTAETECLERAASARPVGPRAWDCLIAALRGSGSVHVRNGIKVRGRCWLHRSQASTS